MKCSGKQHPYPSEIERLNKEMKEKKFKDVVDQASSNKENLKKLDQRFKSESKSITAILNSNIEKVSQALHEDSQEFKKEMKSLKNELMKLEQQIIEEFNNELRMGMYSEIIDTLQM